MKLDALTLALRPGLIDREIYTGFSPNSKFKLRHSWSLLLVASLRGFLMSQQKYRDLQTQFEALHVKSFSIRSERSISFSFHG